MAACLADRGIQTFGVETDSEKLALLKKGAVPFYEFGLQEIFARCLKTKRLEITDDHQKAVESSEVTFITVGTPSNPDGSISLRQVRLPATA